MATNKAANRAPAPKAPERKRVKDYTCKGCGQTVSSRKSVAVRIGDKVERYCLHCAAPCDSCHKPFLKGDLHLVLGLALCPACRCECTVCHQEGVKRSMPQYKGIHVCESHLRVCASCRHPALESTLVNGVCPGCRVDCTFCGANGVRRAMTHVPDRNGYCCVRHRLSHCSVCGKTFADTVLPPIDHPNPKRGKVVMCGDCAPRCFICGKVRHKYFMAYQNCDVHGMRWVCKDHKIGEKHDASPGRVDVPKPVAGPAPAAPKAEVEAVKEQQAR